MKYWIRRKKMQPDTILFLRFNNWFHAFHQDADVIRSIFDVEYDPGNVARVSIHCMYVESLFETIESENYESDIFYFMHTNNEWYKRVSTLSIDTGTGKERET